MNKKGQFETSVLGTAMNSFLIIMVLGIIVISSIFLYDAIQSPKQAEEKCGQLGMELFEYYGGSLFISSSITCWNPETKETRKIR